MNIFVFYILVILVSYLTHFVYITYIGFVFHFLISHDVILVFNISFVFETLESTDSRIGIAFLLRKRTGWRID